MKWLRALHPLHTDLPRDDRAGQQSRTSFFNADTVADAAQFGSTLFIPVGPSQSPATRLSSEVPYSRDERLRKNVVVQASQQALASISPDVVQSMKAIDGLTKKQCVLQRRFRMLSVMNRDDERRLNDFISVLEKLPTTAEMADHTEGALLRLEKLFLRSSELSEKLVADVRVNKRELVEARKHLEVCLRVVLVPLGLLAQVEEEGEDEEDEEEYQELNLDASEYSEQNQPIETATQPNLSCRPYSTTSESSAMVIARQNLHATSTHLRDAQHRIAAHPAAYASDCRAYKRALEAGTCGTSITTFDLRHWLNAQKLTRELIEAEDAASRAASEAQKAGALEAHEEQSSRFADCIEDKEIRDHEAREAVAAVDRRRVERWRRGLPIAVDEDESGPQAADDGLAEWDTPSLQAGESVCGFAAGRSRRKIMLWDKIRRGCSQ